MQQKIVTFTQRSLVPALLVFGCALVSQACYLLSARIDSASFQQLIAGIFGTTYFLSVALGGAYVYGKAYVKGAPFFERVLAASFTPFAWATKESLLLLESHPWLECLYWYFNPLNVWLATILAFEMAAATLIARKILKSRGASVEVWTPVPVIAAVGSLAFGIAVFAWGQGENLYVLFLSGYRHLFGTGL